MSLQSQDAARQHVAKRLTALLDRCRDAGQTPQVRTECRAQRKPGEPFPFAHTTLTRTERKPAPFKAMLIF